MGKRCPRCRHYSMQAAGRIRAGPKRGYRPVFACKRCGHRCIK